ncbi:FAD-dependent oxidoreductase [Dactylosporangium sp. NPDC050588]|uniref:FAD-dependent oxidoreductase n=1 Tax=Dactylosporangium sp. NPDC050588 TaxID=3157211 RepID=UPI0033E3C156
MGFHEVGIVGAGVHGLSAAYHLARRGVSTVVFERGTRAAGPTGRASGVVRSYYTNPFLAEVARDSTAVLADFADQVGARPRGGGPGERHERGQRDRLGAGDAGRSMRTASGSAASVPSTPRRSSGVMCGSMRPFTVTCASGGESSTWQTRAAVGTDPLYDRTGGCGEGRGAITIG